MLNIGYKQENISYTLSYNDNNIYDREKQPGVLNNLVCFNKSIIAGGSLHYFSVLFVCVQSPLLTFSIRLSEAKELTE